MIARARLADRWRILVVTLGAYAAQANHEHPEAVRAPARAGRRQAVHHLAENGETVTSPVTVRFGLAGMGVAPAGVASPNTGHHHLIIDAPTPPADAPIPKDDKHLHFGGGQTETSARAGARQAQLHLVLADKDHMIFDPPLVSETMTITVK